MNSSREGLSAAASFTGRAARQAERQPTIAASLFNTTEQLKAFSFLVRLG